MISLKYLPLTYLQHYSMLDINWNKVISDEDQDGIFLSNAIVEILFCKTFVLEGGEGRGSSVHARGVLKEEVCTFSATECKIDYVRLVR